MSPTRLAAEPPSSPTLTALELRMRHGVPPVLSVIGEVDAATTPHLAELLWARLQSTFPALVLDLGAVRFLGLTGVELLARAHSYARHRGIVLNLVNNTRCVDRALLVSDLDTTLPCFASVAAARTAARQAGSAGTTEPEPALPSELACEICGHHALAEDSPHEFAQNLTDRLICQVCGAHRLS